MGSIRLQHLFLEPHNNIMHAESTKQHLEKKNDEEKSKKYQATIFRTTVLTRPQQHYQTKIKYHKKTVANTNTCVSRSIWKRRSRSASSYKNSWTKLYLPHPNITWFSKKKFRYLKYRRDPSYQAAWYKNIPCIIVAKQKKILVALYILCKDKHTKKKEKRRDKWILIKAGEARHD